jgi:hypothetical protein
MKQIKRRFPIGSVLLLGFNNIKTKPFRFSITLILFSVTLFLTGAGYSAADIHIANAYINAFQDTGEKYAMISIDGENSDIPMNKVIASEIKAAYGDYDFTPIYGGRNVFSNNLSEVKQAESELYYQPFGLMAINEARMENYGMSLAAGRLPIGRREIALPLSLYYRFADCGYQYMGESKRIQSYQDILGLTILAHSGRGNLDTRMTVVGIIDTGFNFQTYAAKYAGGVYDGERERQKALHVLGDMKYHMACFISEDMCEELFENRYDYASYELTIVSTEIKYALASNVDIAEEKGLSITFCGDARTLSAGEVILSKEALWEYFCTVNPFPYQVDEAAKQEMLNEYIISYPQIDIQLNDYFTANYNINRSHIFRIAGYFEEQGETGELSNLLLFSELDLADIKPETPPADINALLVKIKGDKRDFELCSIDEQRFGGHKMRLITLFEADVQIAKTLSHDLSRLGLYAGYGFGVFSILMMFNFISGSIYAKKREIGALRAFGANSGTIFSIYAIESLLTAMFSSLIAVIGMFVFAHEFNLVPAYTIVKVKMFAVTYKQILAVTGLGTAIALAGCALPVINFIKKRPALLIK